MQEGSTPEHENAMLYIKWAHGEGSDSLPPQFQMNATSVAELLVIMRNDPEAAVEYANRLKNAVGRDELRPSAGMEEELLGNLGRIEDSVAASPGYDPETKSYYPPEREFLGILLLGMTPKREIIFLPKDLLIRERL
jgi:hypothetical protein